MLLASACFAFAACSADTSRPPSDGQVWATSCGGDLYAILHPDGTFVEAGDGRGTWRREGNTLRFRVIAHPGVEFLSMYPELISLDDDGLLPFVDEKTIEAELGGLRRRFYRCS
ncbi:hypothetical protein G7078_02170 [Sphingomonas sinipercae]|uniref:Uncharacterized protein n=1 Tax=Sphingomonas sinipercae TaxID=2714944 RepID=A0A6G7ZL34_9SPHN|nr:hypothetical protein [Sphingomonas sinipercae]QIL01707.1 hypothetical protein G7078_02170 [Sphingomonas sinipercae]